VCAKNKQPLDNTKIGKFNPKFNSKFLTVQFLQSDQK